MSSNLKVNSLVPATGTEIGIGTTGGSIDFRCPATFGGNVTIGGTLTYDEVINIDSIGIITARSNIDCNGDLDVDGHTELDNVNIAGVVTATTYKGNGNSMTGIHTVATNPSIAPSNSNLAIGNAGSYRFIQSHGNVELKLNPIGNGVWLPANSYVSDSTRKVANISNNADNRIITGADTNGRLNAEANLTWDGSVLSASGSDAQLRLYDSTASSENSAFRLMAYNGINYIQSGKAFSGGSSADLVFSNMFGQSNLMRLTSGGQLNLGTSNAVNSQTTFKAQIETATNKLISFGASEGSTYNDYGAALIFSRPQDGATRICGIYQHTNQSLGIGVRDDFTISTGGNAFYYSATERLRIDSSGRMGLGTNNPTSLFHMSGSAPRITLTDTAGTDDFAKIFSTGGSLYFQQRDGSSHGNIIFRTEDSSGAKERLRIKSDGELVINHTQSSAPLNNTFLSIYDANSDSSAIDASGISKNYAMISLHNYGTGVSGDTTGIGFGAGSAFSYTKGSIAFTRSGSYGTGDLVFLTNNDQNTTMVNDTDERMRITSSGHVGINYGVNPNRYLQVRTIDGAAHNGVFAGENVNSSNAATMFFLSTYRDSSSTEKFMQFNRDQNQDGQGVLAVFDVLTNGNVRNLNSSYGSISDVKLKENIIDASSQWDDIKNVRVRKFNFKSAPSETLIGVVAQEIETVSPGLVDDIPDMDLTKEGDEGTSTKSVKYSILYMKAIKCLQEAQARIETLEAKVAALEGS